MSLIEHMMEPDQVRISKAKQEIPIFLSLKMADMSIIVQITTFSLVMLTI